MGVLTRVTRGFGTGFRRRPRFPLDFRHSFEETVPSLPLVAFYPARHIMIILLYIYMVHIGYIFGANSTYIYIYIFKTRYMICDTDTKNMSQRSGKLRSFVSAGLR